MKFRQFVPEIVCLMPIGIGAVGLARWTFGPSSIGQSYFGFPELGFVAPALLLLMSFALFGLRYTLQRRPPESLGSTDEKGSTEGLELCIRACCLIVATVAALMLFEHLSGVSVGVDIRSSTAVPTARNPFPGRMSPNACTGFLCLSLAVFLASVGRSNRWPSIFIGGAGMVAAAGVIGRALHFEHLYRWGSANQLTTQVGLGIGLLALAMWLAHDQASAGDVELDTYEGRITRRSIAVLSMIAVGAGTGGFSIVQSLYDDSKADHLALTTAVNGESMAYSLDVASWLVKTAASRPVVTETLAHLNEQPGDATARAFLEKVDQSFVSAGLAGMSFQTLTGESVTAGHLSLNSSEPALGMTAAFAGSRIVYSAGYVFATELPVYDRGRLVGRLVAEQRLALLEDLIAKLKASTATTDVLICGRTGDSAFCLPSRFYQTAFSVALFDAKGQPTRLISRAVLGQTGVATNTDLNGNDVIAAYEPLGHSGLGLVVKTQIEAFYAPVRTRLVQLLIIMGLLIAAGSVALRSQVRPLVARLAAEQRRSWAILENSNDAFVSLDRHGYVDAWNVEASRTFGWTSAEAIGRKLSDLIIPPEMRESHERGVERFVKHGTGPVVNHRIELTALHRDGRAIPIELSVASTDRGGYFTATAFLRDISARKRSEETIVQAERRLRLVTDNMPALISHVDLSYRYTLVNAHYCSWFSRPEADFVGKTVTEVFGADIFENVRSHMDRAFSGEEVVFELINPIPGAPKYMLVHYIPERDSAGEVIGLYGLVLDRTEQHNAAARVESSERQLRAVADNLPVLITYVDAAEKIKFLNATFHDWLGVDTHAAIGRPIGDVIGPVNYLQRKDQIQAALAGERVEFEVVSQTLGGVRDLQTVYIPDIRTDGSVQGIFTLSTDVTAMKQVEKQLTAQARIDSLTGLPNRRQFEERLEEALLRSKRTARAMALLFLDVDHFKGINDARGHATGDAVLREFGRRLQIGIRKTDMAARLAGDEFVVVLEGLHIADEASAVAQKLVDAIGMPMSVCGHVLTVTTSMGVAYCNAAAEAGEAKELLERADRALYVAKARGRNTFSLGVGTALL